MLKRIHNPIRAWQHILDRVTICSDEEAKNGLVLRLISRQQPCVLSFINAHAANLAWQDAAFYEYIIASDVIVRDGAGMRLFFALLDRNAGMNLSGTDLIPELLDRSARDNCLAVYGTQEPYLSAGVDRLQSMGFEQVHAEHGFHGDEYYVERFVDTHPSVVILAMGMPKQERVASLLRRVASGENYSSLIINGGAIIDFMANRVPRAPLWLQKLSLEWLYRLIQEPRRLWRRYIIGSPVFILRVLLMLVLGSIKQSS